MADEISGVLKEIREGICLAKPHGSLIYSGEQTTIVLPKLFKSMINNLVYLIEDNLCFGVIRLLNANKISKDEFKELSEQHKISEEMRDKWWPNKEVLFSYDFESMYMFDTPRRVNIQLCDIDTFVDNFEFLEEQEMIKGDIKAYDATKLDTDVLKDDWRIVCAWYSSKMQNQKTKHSLEDIINLAKLIYDELKKRGITFHPDSMTPYSKELYLRVSGKKTIDLNDPDLLSELADKMIIKDFMSVVGSYAEGRKDPHDVDILVRMREPTPYLKRAIETRFMKDTGFSDHVHFIWGDSEGPHDTFIPLYDLQLKRINPLKIIKMQQMDLAQASPFFPMKPSHRFYHVEDILPFMFKLNNEFSIEKKFDGFRILIIKTGEGIKIYTEHKREVTNHFPTIVHEAKILSNKDYIIDCELVFKDGGRSEIINYFIGEGKKLDDTLLTAWTFDITNFDGEDISNRQWFERKSILHQFKFSKHIKEVHSIVVSNEDEAKKAIKFTKELPGTEGAMVKQYDGKYKKNGKTDDWIKFRNVDPLNVRVMEVHTMQQGYSYRMGVSTNGEPERFKPDYLSEDKKYLLLGNTFVTSLKFEVGGIINVLVEEVWKHIYPQKKIRFSAHKPKVMGKAEGGITSWTVLDHLAVSKGQSVQEFCEFCQNLSEEVEVENHVVKKGNRWCVVHGHPKKPGSKTDKPMGAIIKCFPTKEKAIAMHKAIIISEAKKAGKMQNYPVPESDTRIEDKPIPGYDKINEETEEDELPHTDLEGALAIPEDDTTRQYDFNSKHSSGSFTMAQPHNDAINSGSNRNYNPVTGEQLDVGGEYGITGPGGIRGGGTVEGDIADVQGKVWQKKQVIDAPKYGESKIKPDPHLDNMPDYTDGKAAPGLQDTFSGIGEKKSSNPIPIKVPENVPPRLSPESTPVWWGLSDDAAADKKTQKTTDEINQMADEQKHEGSEGGEYMINDFPGRMQRNFMKVMEWNQWKDFVMQWHLRGTKSIHTDLRLDIGEHLEGFTMFTPGGMDGEDKLDEQPHNIRGTIKLPQPKEWLKVHGGFPKGQPGTTTNHDAYFAIIAKGKYRPVLVNDHVIKFEFATDHGACLRVAPITDEDRDYVKTFNEKLPENLKELNGYFEFHIAHIGDRHIILFDKVHSS